MIRLAAVQFTFLLLVFSVGCGGGASSAAPPPTPAAPDFSITTQPSTLNLVLGTSSQVQVEIQPRNGFSGTVSVDSSSLPAGVSISPALPQNIAGSGLNLTVSTANNALPGSYNLQLTGASGSLQHAAALSLSLGNRANSSITVVSQNVNVPKTGSPASVVMNIDTGSGIVDYNLQLQVSTPSGVTAQLSNSTVVPPTQIAFTLLAGSTAPQGPGTVTVQAIRNVDGVSVSGSFPVYVDPQPGSIPGNRTSWVRTGSNPIATYYDAPRKHVFASLPAMNLLDVIDPGTGNVVSTIPVSLAGYEPNGVWLASSSNISGTLNGNYLLALGAGHVSTIDLASLQMIAQRALPMAIPIGWTTPQFINPTFLVAAAGGHIIMGSWGDFSFYNWDGVSSTASLHTLSDVYSFDRNFDGTKVLIASGDTSGAYQLLDVASDTLAAQGNYSNATIMTVRGNPVRNEWAVANNNGIDFLDPNLNLVARVQVPLVGSISYWGMTYSADGKYLYFVYSPSGLPFLITVNATTHSVVQIAPATGTDLAYYLRVPSEWITQPFSADNTGLVFGLGQKGTVIDDSAYGIDPTQATPADYAILATPDSGPLTATTSVQITTQSFNAQPDVWFGFKRASAESLSAAGQVSAAAPPGQSMGPENIKVFPPDGYAHVMPQAFTYGTVITSVRNSICASSGGCAADIFGFGLFNASGHSNVMIGGNAAPVQSVHYFNADQPYPYPLQYLRVMVPPGLAGRADISVASGTGSATLAGGFLYANSIQSFPSSQFYNALLYDEGRDILYASTDSQIARYAPGTATFLTPITPPTLTGKSQFQAMSLTPDGSRLLVANKLDESIAVIDPNNPANATAVAVPASTSAGPLFVAATSTGKALISMSGFSTGWLGPLFELDLSTMQIQATTSVGGDSAKLCPTSDGTELLARGYGGAVQVWKAATGQFYPVQDNFPGSGLGAAAGDGNVFAVGQGIIGNDLNSLIAMAIPDEFGGSFNFFPNDGALNDSGSLAFIPDSNTLFIFDTHHGTLLRSLPLPNQVNVWTKVIALDSTAQHVFLSDSQGLTIVDLASPPLAIGSVTPPIVSAAGSTPVKVRGSGFQPGTNVTVGGTPALSTFVDANTLDVILPANPTGAAQMILRNPDGETYKLDSAVYFQ